MSLKHRMFGECPKVIVQSGVTLVINANGEAVLGGVVVPVAGGVSGGRPKFKFFSIVVTTGPATATVVFSYQLADTPGASNWTAAGTGAELHGITSYTSGGGEVVAYLWT